MTRYKLKPKELPGWRIDQVRVQQERCPICGGNLWPHEAVADHCHSTGAMRGALHRGCNALLGKLENNYRRYGVTFLQLKGIAPRVAEYLAADYSRTPLYPTHKTEDEKRELRNKRARQRRARLKESA